MPYIILALASENRLKRTENSTETFYWDRFLYEFLKPYYAHFLYIAPTQFKPGVLWMGKHEVSTLYAYVDTSTPEVLVNLDEESIPMPLLHKTKSSIGSQKKISLCSNNNRNRVEVEASQEKSSSGESEKRGKVTFEHEFENGKKLGGGVEHSRKHSGGDTNKETKANLYYEFYQD